MSCCCCCRRPRRRRRRRRRLVHAPTPMRGTDCSPDAVVVVVVIYVVVVESSRALLNLRRQMRWGHGVRGSAEGGHAFVTACSMHDASDSCRRKLLSKKVDEQQLTLRAVSVLRPPNPPEEATERMDGRTTSDNNKLVTTMELNIEATMMDGGEAGKKQKRLERLPGIEAPGHAAQRLSPASPPGSGSRPGPEAPPSRRRRYPRRPRQRSCRGHGPALVCQRNAW